MSWDLKATEGKAGATERPPAGNHLAVLVGIFDMGSQWQEAFAADEPGYYQRRAFFVWELVGVKVSGTTKNHVIGMDLTLSMNDKAKLRKFVEARTGKKFPEGAAFNPTTELGQPCLLNVVLKDKYPRVEGVAGLPDALKAIPVTPTYEPTAVSLDEFQSGAKVIPDWCPWFYGNPLADHINACKEIGKDKPKPRAKKEDAGRPADLPADPNSPVPF